MNVIRLKTFNFKSLNKDKLIIGSIIALVLFIIIFMNWGPGGKKKEGHIDHKIKQDINHEIRDTENLGLGDLNILNDMIHKRLTKPPKPNVLKENEKKLDAFIDDIAQLAEGLMKVQNLQKAEFRAPLPDA